MDRKPEPFSPPLLAILAGLGGGCGYWRSLSCREVNNSAGGGGIGGGIGDGCWRDVGGTGGGTGGGIPRLGLKNGSFARLSRRMAMKSIKDDFYYIVSVTTGVI